jgi:hypothetical protein
MYWYIPKQPVSSRCRAPASTFSLESATVQITASQFAPSHGLNRPILQATHTFRRDSAAASQRGAPGPPVARSCPGLRCHVRIASYKSVPVSRRPRQFPVEHGPSFGGPGPDTALWSGHSGPARPVTYPAGPWLQTDRLPTHLRPSPRLQGLAAGLLHFWPAGPAPESALHRTAGADPNPGPRLRHTGRVLRALAHTLGHRGSNRLGRWFKRSMVPLNPFQGGSCFAR